MLQIMVQGGVFGNIPKYYQNGTWMGKWPELIFFFNMHARRDTQNKFPFSPGANLGGFGLLKNGGNCMFQIMVQGGVFPMTYPNSAKMALGWLTGRN